jgi:putative hemolysin
MVYQFTLFFILLLCSAFFSASETALFSLSRVQIHRLRASKSRAARSVVACVREPRPWLATILFGNELVNVCISIIGASIISFYFSYSVMVQTMIAVALITPVILIFGEILPKNIAIKISPQLAPIMIVPLRIFYDFIKPFRFVMTKIADFFVILLGGHPEKSRPMIVEEEFRRLIDLGRKEGVIVEEEREMIHKVFEFTDKIVADIMTPAGQIFALSANLPYQQMLSEIKATQFSRIPLYEGNLNNMIGILHVRDLFGFHRKREAGGEQDIRSIVRGLLIVDSNKKIEELLKDFQQSRLHMAVVKSGDRVIGLVTMGDVLAELFGEIEK